jgi:sortase family protein
MVVPDQTISRATYAGAMSGPDDITRRSSARRQRALVFVPLLAALVAVLVVSVVMIVVTQRQAEPTPVAHPTPWVLPTLPTPSPTPSACEPAAAGPFKPTRITVPGIVRNARVLALPRDGHDVPSVPPISNAGKGEFAWDRPPGIKPGSPKGNVLLNAHTWPDGSALGNHFLRDLRKGDRIIVRGKDVRLCYEVSRRVEVPAHNDFPEYYDTTGPPQLALIVCSGQRLGPGNWTKRTIWFASPA